MEIVPFVYSNGVEDGVDSQAMEPGGGERGGEGGQEHVCAGEGGEDGGGDGICGFPFEGVVVQVGFDEGAAGALPAAVGGGVVGGGEAGEVGGFGEGDWAGHGCGVGGGGSRRRWMLGFAWILLL